MTRKIISIFLLITILLTMLIGCGDESSRDEPTLSRIPVKINSVRKDSVEETYITIGEVVPNNQLDVYLNTTGEIENIFVEPGDYLEKGMPMFQILNKNTNNTLNILESQLRTIKNNLAIRYRASLDGYNQQKSLFELGATSQNALDASYDQLRSTQGQYQDAITNYNNQMVNLKDAVNDLLVKSPINGQIATVHVKVGQKAANQLAATVIDTSALYVKTMVSGELKKTLKNKQEVRLTLEGNANRVKGQISLINEIPDMQSKLFEIRIAIENTENINVGDFSEVEFIINAYETLLVPSTAIVRKGIEKYVFLYIDGKIEKVVLETGLSKGEWVEVITDKLFENSQIIVRGQNNLREGDDFEIVE